MEIEEVDSEIAKDKINAAADLAEKKLLSTALLAEEKIRLTALEASSLATSVINDTAKIAECKITAAALVAENKIKAEALIAEDKIVASAVIAEDKIVASAVITQKNIKFSNKKSTIGFITLGIITLFTITKVFLMDTKDNKNQTTIVDVLVDIKTQVKRLANSDSIMKIQLEHYPSASPIAINSVSRVTSNYSERISPITGQKEFHYGIDYAAKKGTPVYATGSGIIEEAGIRSGFGDTVEIEHGNKYKSLYGHLSKIMVKKGDNIKRGDILGLVGSTGESTGPHLHYEIYYGYEPINPNIFK